MNKARPTGGHGVLQMDALVTSALEASVEKAAHPFYVRALLDVHKEDLQWPLLVAVFNRYGLSGRFYSLNQLGQGTRDEVDAPSEFWKSR